MVDAFRKEAALVTPTQQTQIDTVRVTLLDEPIEVRGPSGTESESALVGATSQVRIEVPSSGRQLAATPGSWRSSAACR